ncbi:hypothetical protein WA158_003955 [Blastocystis sp. Blastoise]
MNSITTLSRLSVKLMKGSPISIKILGRSIETVSNPDFFIENAQKGNYFVSIDKYGKVSEIYDTKLGISDKINNTDFCDTFFTFLRRNNMKINTDYPYVCKRGNDFFFAKSEDRPIVFHTIGSDTLTYAKSLTCEFKPKNLAICLANKNIYYPLVGSYIGGVGVFSPAIQETLKKYIKESKSENTKCGYYIEWNKHKHELEGLGIEEIILEARK